MSKSKTGAGKGDAPRNCHTPKFRSGWDDAFMKTGAEWAKKFELTILDPDGWDRATDDFTTLKISETNFHQRASRSTTCLSKTYNEYRQKMTRKKY